VFNHAGSILKTPSRWITRALPATFPVAIVLAVGSTWLSAQAVPAPTTLDLASTGGFKRTCGALLPLKPARLANDDQRVAWAVCRDVDLTRQLATWFDQGMRQMEQKRPSNEQIEGEIHRQIDRTLAHLRATRNVLERVQLGERKSITLAPATWQLDLNGDGQTKPWERYFFAIPRRAVEPANFDLPSNDEARYQTRFALQAQIKVDQSDVLWALSYHQFIEGLLTNLQAFDLNLKTFELTLARPALLATAHQLIGQGLATSDRLRHNVLTERSDDHEWLGHPGQANSVFPIPLDAEDFVVWREALAGLSDLWHGRHLLPTTKGARGLLGSLAPACEPGQGLDIASLYLQPPPAGTKLNPAQIEVLLRGACRAVDAEHPMSPLPNRLDRAQQGATGLSGCATCTG
jgi:hypothetical protein